MLKSPFITNNQNTKKPLQEAVFSLLEINKIKEDLLALKTKHEVEHKAKIAEIDAKIADAHTHIKTIKKGDKGDSFIGSKGDKGDTVVGPRGLPGKDAIVDEPKIVKTVLAKIPAPIVPDIPTLKDLSNAVLDFIVKNKLLKTEHISNFTDGFEQTIAPIRSLAAGFRGGGDTVAAGTGVTITNNNGVKTINASGGGFTTLTATEVPDGNITVYTFAAAVAQPSFLVLDNVWVTAVSKKGTVQWTWNAGAKQATLVTVPAPNEDAFAIV